jgi:hypothetical protein
MADKKISELGSASLPLSGTELVPIVQGGVTKKVPVNEIGGGGDFMPSTIIVNNDTTAVNDTHYTVVQNTIFTDPSNSEGHSYTAVLRRGNMTIGGVTYTVAGTEVKRIYSVSGGWQSYVYKNDSQLQDKGVRLTNATVTGSTNLDWSAYKVFKFTLTGTTTLVDVNLPTGTATEVIEMVIGGNFTLNIPAYWTALPSNDTYDGTGLNHLVISCVNGTSSSEEVYYSLENL